MVAEAVRESINDIQQHAKMASPEERDKLAYLSSGMKTCWTTAERAFESSLQLKDMTEKYSHDQALCKLLANVQRNQSAILKTNVDHLFDSASHYQSEYAPGSPLFDSVTTRRHMLRKITLGGCATPASSSVSRSLSALSFGGDAESPPTSPRSRARGADGDGYAHGDREESGAEPGAVAVDDTMIMKGECGGADEMARGRRSEGYDVDTETKRWRQHLIRNALYVAQFATAILILVRNQISSETADDAIDAGGPGTPPSGPTSGGPSVTSVPRMHSPKASHSGGRIR
jgi:hypothetical protein